MAQQKNPVRQEHTRSDVSLWNDGWGLGVAGSLNARHCAKNRVSQVCVAQQVVKWASKSLGAPSKEHHMRQAIQSTSESSSLQGSGDHLLLTVLGTNPKSTRYVLGEKEHEADLAPIALLKLLPDFKKPNRVLAFCTPEAEHDSWGALKDALGNRYQATLVPIHAGTSPENQVNAYLKKVAEVVPHNAEITVDVTHGPRHFSFLIYVAILYLSALHNIPVRGAYYGLLGSTTSQFLDLYPLLKLPDWIYALKVMDETGSTLPLAKVIRNSGKESIARQTKEISREISKELEKLSEEYLSGLPIEMGRRTKIFCQEHPKQLRKLLKSDGLPCGEELVGHLDKVLKPLEFNQNCDGDGWKRKVKLDKEELKRQAVVIDRLFDHANMANALRLLSEWTISWVIWNRGNKEQWLDYTKERQPAASLLHMIKSIHDDNDLKSRLSQDLDCLAIYWKELSDLRNGYAHHGMRPQHLVDDRKSESQLKKIHKYWKETLRGCPSLDLSPVEPQGRMLVSPIGMATGVLFSALRALQTEEGGGEPPIRCLVICSDQTKGKIAEAAEHAAYDMDKVVPLCLEDPYGGSGEIKRLEKASRQHFIDATGVVVNVTGGTTVMGLTAQALAGTARRLARQVRRFGLIDQRTPDQQKADPYRVGEVFWIDSPIDPGGADEH